MNDDRCRNFELGPIRPPSEAGSILLRLTRNCPWNQCAFCHSYKGEKFSRRSVEEVKADIDTVAVIAEKVAAAAQTNGTPIIDRGLISGVVEETGFSEDSVRQVVFWLYHGMESLFLQDADSLVMKTDDVAEILRYIKKRFPSIRRITTYARARTVARKSIDDLKLFREAGLDRIHIGLESGSRTVLDLIRKGATPEEQISAGKKAMEAGFELSEYYMPGAGGKAHLEESARESARVLTEINPTFIRLRSVVPLPDTPLFGLIRDGRWIAPSEEDKVREIKLFLEALGPVTSIVKSDHIMNLIEDIDGKLPEGRERIMAPIDRFMSMQQEDRELFIIGRRTGRFRLLSDYRKSMDLEQIRRKIMESYPNLDEAILEILWNYI
ncbi:MAG TPA: radical SAM protein [Spirochaetota bacterium]|nr:radical SAM protein [Spirochaetota bacterium]